MYKIATLDRIAACGMQTFNKDGYQLTDNDPDAILLRSTSMHDMELPKSLKSVARAGAGVNNIPLNVCSQKGIVVFNTPGANANAVKELAICALFLASRKIVQSCEWVKTISDKGADIPKLVEKGKSNFTGPELEGKKLAILGLGAIGVMVANACCHLGMDVVGYDPFITVKSALGLSRNISVVADLKACLDDADYVTIHAPLSKATKHMLCQDTFNMMKNGVRILNFSRGELVDDEAMRAALACGQVAVYVTDFPNEDTLSMENCISIPHLGASTPESEDNCAVMAARQTVEFLENGNITNSVNFPDAYLQRTEAHRMTIAHKNVPNMIGQFTKITTDAKVNIADMLNKSASENAYTIIDVNGDIPAAVIEKIERIDGVYKVRSI